MISYYTRQQIELHIYYGAKREREALERWWDSMSFAEKFFIVSDNYDKLWRNFNEPRKKFNVRLRA